MMMMLLFDTGVQFAAAIKWKGQSCPAAGRGGLYGFSVDRVFGWQRTFRPLREALKCYWADHPNSRTFDGWCFSVRAASPADCSAKPEQGAWVKVKMIQPPSLPSGNGGAGHFSAVGCGIVYGCRAKEAMITDARCKVVFTPDRTVTAHVYRRATVISATATVASPRRRRHLIANGI